MAVYDKTPRTITDATLGDVTLAQVEAEVRAGRVVVSVLDFPNIVRDGVTVNATEDVQEFIDAVEAVRGVGEVSGEIVYPGGLVIDTQGVTLRGVSPQGSIGFAEVGTAFRSTSTTVDALTIKADGVCLEDIQVQGPGNSSGTARGVVLDTGVANPPTTSRCVLRRVWVRGFPGDGFVAIKAEALLVEASWFTGNGGKGCLIDSSAGGLSNPTNPVLLLCRFADNLGAHQLHVKDAIGPALLVCQCLNGTGGNANCRLQNVYAPLVLGGDYEAGGASGIQVSGSAGKIDGPHCIAVATGINCTAWTDGIIEACRFPSSVTNSIVADASCRIGLGVNQDASTGGMNLNAAAEVTMVRKRQARAWAANLTPNPFLGEYVEVAALTGAIAIANPTNRAKGLRLTFRFLQDGTGGRAVTFGNQFKHAWSDTGNTANKQSTVTFEFDGANWVQIGAQSPYV